MILEVRSIGRTYGKKVILKDLTFVANEGEILGLVGPNGAGKTTLLNILTEMIRPSSGSFEFKKGQEVSASISRKGFFSGMSVTDNLKMYASLSSLSQADVKGIMSEFDIDFGSKDFGKLSAGMKQRVALACAFMKPHSIMLLDEPTNHLDIESIISLRNRIETGKAQGTSFLITSHIFSDLEKICDRILFLKEGSVLGDFTLSEIQSNYGSLEESYIQLFKVRDNA